VVILVIFGEQYRSWSSSLRHFRHSPVTSSLPDPNNFLSTLFSNSAFPSTWDTRFHTHTKQPVKL
jgi:hypothetical protein